MIDKINSTQTSAVQTQTTNAVMRPAEKRSEPQKIEKRDEYVSSEEKEPIGLYSVSPDEEGGNRISYDESRKASEKDSSSNDDDSEETVTANTDRVDNEIKKLRERSQVLTEKLRSAEPENADKIRRELDAVSSELAQKDNDQYRRKNTVFS